MGKRTNGTFTFRGYPDVRDTPLGYITSWMAWREKLIIGLCSVGRARYTLSLWDEYDAPVEVLDFIKYVDSIAVGRRRRPFDEMYPVIDRSLTPANNCKWVDPLGYSFLGREFL